MASSLFVIIIVTYEERSNQEILINCLKFFILKRPICFIGKDKVFLLHLFSGVDVWVTKLIGGEVSDVQCFVTVCVAIPWRLVMASQGTYA